ncbi:MAG: phosphoserine transaminase [Rickettsiaceae bacterium]|jgi:phosphoserine aminotransferase|nr:phosphoserine transaminase [Rickettsiaceae bacterium]
MTNIVSTNFIKQEESRSSIVTRRSVPNLARESVLKFSLPQLQQESEKLKELLATTTEPQKRNQKISHAVGPVRSSWLNGEGAKQKYENWLKDKYKVTEPELKQMLHRERVALDIIKDLVKAERESKKVPDNFRITASMLGGGHGGFETALWCLADKEVCIDVATKFGESWYWEEALQLKKSGVKVTKIGDEDVYGVMPSYKGLNPEVPFFTVLSGTGTGTGLSPYDLDDIAKVNAPKVFDATSAMGIMDMSKIYAMKNVVIFYPDQKGNEGRPGNFHIIMDDAAIEYMLANQNQTISIPKTYRLFSEENGKRVLREPLFDGVLNPEKDLDLINSLDISALAETLYGLEVLKGRGGQLELNIAKSKEHREFMAKWLEESATRFRQAGQEPIFSAVSNNPEQHSHSTFVAQITDPWFLQLDDKNKNNFYNDFHKSIGEHLSAARVFPGTTYGIRTWMVNGLEQEDLRHYTQAVEYTYLKTKQVAIGKEIETLQQKDGIDWSKFAAERKADNKTKQAGQSIL